jgi:hypothetical protein
VITTLAGRYPALAGLSNNIETTVPFQN